jgi:hypothetical protein
MASKGKPAAPVAKGDFWQSVTAKSLEASELTAMFPLGHLLPAAIRETASPKSHPLCRDNADEAGDGTVPQGTGKGGRTMKHHPGTMPRSIAEPHAQFDAPVSHDLNSSGFSTDGAAHASPGQRPGIGSPWDQALKARHNGCHAPSGMGLPFGIEPRILPWTGLISPFGAQEKGLHYGG